MRKQLILSGFVTILLAGCSQISSLTEKVQQETAAEKASAVKEQTAGENQQNNLSESSNGKEDAGIPKLEKEFFN